MSSQTQQRGFRDRLISLGTIVLTIVALLSGSLCAVPICAMPNSHAPSGCGGMDKSNSGVSIVAASVPACCQISQAPPARTELITDLQRIEIGVLRLDRRPTATTFPAPRPFACRDVAISPPADPQSLLSVFLI